MTDEPQPDEQSIDRYDAAVTAIEKPVADLFTYSRRSRNLIWALMASLVFDLILSVSLGVVAVQASRASDAATKAASLANSTARAATLACDARNEFKALDLKRWTYIVDLGRDVPKTGTPAEQEAEAERTRQFIAFITAADEPERCD